MVANRYEYSLWVQGDKGDLWTDRRRVWWRPKGRRFFWPVKLVPVPKGDEQRYPRAGTVSLLNQFRDALTQGNPPETSGEDNLWTLAMVEAGILSVREGRKVQIDEVFSPALQDQAGIHSKRETSLMTKAALHHGKKRVLFIGLDAGRHGTDRTVVPGRAAAKHRADALPRHVGAYADHG